jgi:signal transduction histidine kinase
MCDRRGVSSGQRRWAAGSRVWDDPVDAVMVVVRVGVLALCGLQLAIRTSGPAAGSQLAMLVAVALMASVPLPPTPVSRLRPLGEAALAATIIGSGLVLPTALLPYIVVPSLAAGLLTGALGAVSATVVSLLVLAVGRMVDDGSAVRMELTVVLEWVVLALATGLVGAWARSLRHRAGLASDTYISAHRLLTQLRDVARQLPTGLDEVTLAQQVMTSIGEELECERGALYTVSDSGVLAPLAFTGADRVEWTPMLDHGIWAKVWRSGRPAQQSGQFQDDVSGHCAVLALRLGERQIGLIGVERAAGQWSHRQLVRAQAIADDAALRIDTGQLFSEVRALATVEERRRLAREIHDGIAQEIASLGYLVDDLRARTQDPTVRTELGQLREELTRLVTELRLSIFDLRSDVQPATGLGATLSSYVRSVGAGSGLTVHLVLDESAHRLTIEAETELLRVAQEAVTNARKHARARNLWVTCRVDPPRAFLRVADDGDGLGSPRRDSFGLEIMRERTARLGATLAIRNRVGGGTVVEVTLGAAAPPVPAVSAPISVAPLVTPGPRRWIRVRGGASAATEPQTPTLRPRHSADHPPLAREDLAATDRTG